MKKIKLYLAIALSAAFLSATLALQSCQKAQPESDNTEEAANDSVTEDIAGVKHPEWSKNATIYEVNIRQYTPEGTFKAFQTHLPRLKELGVDILWLMPIHPIGEKERKGKLGSYYAVKDYRGVNPEFGTMEDFKAFVTEVHKLGMKVILDWVPNHSAWDNPWITQHPDWYTQDSTGKIIHPEGTDWTDVADFNYDNPALRKEMISALQFWVEEADIDGYRCDVAGSVPTDFWNDVRPALDEIKPVFMLAEWEATDLHERAFDMTYGWSLYEVMHKVAKGEENASSITKHFMKEFQNYPKTAYRMYFVDNHDKNSWDGTVFEQFGDGLEAFMVLAATAQGMPLIYAGQEAGLDRRLKFFEKDEIEWKEHKFAGMYKTLMTLNHENKALWNGQYGGQMQILNTNQPKAIFAFLREQDGNRVLTILNLSKEKQSFSIAGDLYADEYKNVFSGETQKVEANTQMTLEPWGYTLLAK